MDGGGAKGMFSLGVLREVEAALESPLLEYFDAFYGTSTGAIIAASLAFGISLQEVIEQYRRNLPRIMGPWRRSARGRQLRLVLSEIFGDSDFGALRKPTTLVASNDDKKEPLIFKREVAAAFGRTATFVPGFGCSIVDAVAASCSAYPFFPKTRLTPTNRAPLIAIDGGFCANNPSLFAWLDAVKSLALKPESVRILSVGVGTYPQQSPIRVSWQLVGHALSADLMQRQFDISANTISGLAARMVPASSLYRVDAQFSEPRYGTSLFETDSGKLETLLDLGKETFGACEKPLMTFLSSARQKLQASL